MTMYASLLSIAVALLCVTLSLAACPPGWRGRGVKCYLFVANDLASWAEAQSICRSHHGQLAELNVHHTWVSNIAMSIRRDTWWIGMTDIEQEGRWVWVNSRIPIPFNHPNWHFGEPNGQWGANCGDINASGNWNDDACHQSKRFICEMPRPFPGPNPAVWPRQMPGPLSGPTWPRRGPGFRTSPIQVTTGQELIIAQDGSQILPAGAEYISI